MIEIHSLNKSDKESDLSVFQFSISGIDTNDMQRAN